QSPGHQALAGAERDIEVTGARSIYQTLSKSPASLSVRRKSQPQREAKNGCVTDGDHGSMWHGRDTRDGNGRLACPSGHPASGAGRCAGRVRLHVRQRGGLACGGLAGPDRQRRELSRLPPRHPRPPAGLAGGYAPEPGIVELVSMWVRPQARGHGVGAALIAAVIDWAKVSDATAVHLWVNEANTRARLLYQRCGFAPTGERGPLPSNPALTEVGMTRPL